jgi:hypothetical protein
VPRRKTLTPPAEASSRPAARNEVVSEVAALLASIDSLSQSWPKGPDGQPVRLGDASMPTEVAERVGRALQTASGSVAKAAALLGQHTLGRPSEAATDPATRAAYAMLQSATAFLKDLGVLEGDATELAKPPIVLAQQTAPEVKAAAMGIADGPKLRRWEPIEGEIALRHVVRHSRR